MDARRTDACRGVHLPVYHQEAMVGPGAGRCVHRDRNDNRYVGCLALGGMLEEAPESCLEGGGVNRQVKKIQQKLEANWVKLN
jgi:hypothetical protein